MNLEAIDALGLDEVGPAELVAHGLARKGDLVKVLARGDDHARGPRLGPRLLEVRG